MIEQGWEFKLSGTRYENISYRKYRIIINYNEEKFFYNTDL
jgi:hypothetical protein